MRYIILDLESHAIPDAATYLTEPVDAPSNYTKPEAIAAYVAKAKQAQLDKAALDIDLARIVCLGYYDVGTSNIPTKATALKNEEEERTAITSFFDAFFRMNQAYVPYDPANGIPTVGMSSWPILVTFNGLGFDLPLLLRRALYLGVKAPNIQIDRFKHPHVIDLMDLLSYSGKMKPHSLSFYCSRFGIPVNDENSGKDIAALIAADNWAAVEAHCASDVQATYALAKRMGVIGG